jgi:ComF family protein
MNYFAFRRSGPIHTPTFRQTAARWQARSANWLLPQECAVCSAVAGQTPICEACHGDLPPLPASTCPRCADTSGSGDLCGRCLSSPPHFDRALAAFAYAGPLPDLIQALKYGHRLYLADWLGRELAAATAGAAADLIIPMPLHPTRLAERGFNQAVEIGRVLARQRRTRLDTDVVERVRLTAAQVDLSLAERQRNLRDAFACRADLSGKHILVIDDVMTSGSSLNELARTLKLHGAQSVCAAVVARTLHE